MGLDGGCLPDGPFYHPTFGVESTPSLDIFGLGSLFYTVVTGCWPYRPTAGPPKTIDEKIAYEKEIAEAFNNGIYPDVTNVVGGTVILACWTGQYAAAEEVLQALETDIPTLKVHVGTEESDHILKFSRVAISIAALVCSTYILIRQHHAN